MGKIEKDFVTKKLASYCSALRNSIQDYANQWLIFEDMQDHLAETIEIVWNEATENAAQEADANGDFATANGIRTYKVKDLEFPYE